MALNTLLDNGSFAVRSPAPVDAYTVRTAAAPKVDAQYRVVKFDACERFIAMAWNYDHAIMVSSDPQTTYARAKSQLADYCRVRNVELRWFDGEYYVPKGSDQMLQAL